MNKSKSVSEEIKLLIISYLTNSIDEIDFRRLKQWIEENNQHREYFNKLRASWILAGKTSGEQKFDSKMQWNALQPIIYLETEQKHHHNHKAKLLLYAGIAASWLIFLALGSEISNWKSSKPADILTKTTEIIAPLGAKSIVKLPDGTTIWLNAGSRITYNQDFDKKDRNIHLVGEAYFNVATNKAKPFIVRTSDIAVRAFGTRFNVKAYPEERTITATLEEGKIDIQVLKSSKEKKQIVLKPKEKIVYYKNSNDFRDNRVENNKLTKEFIQAPVSPKREDIEVVGNINTELYTSWKDGRWIIEALPLASLVPMLERRFNMKIKFDNDELKNYKFTGTIENETIEQILAALRYTAPIDYDIQKDTIRLMLNKQLKDQYLHLIKSN